MSGLEERSVSCPYCGEAIAVLIDTSVDQQQYIEDCQVCCSPIEFTVVVHAAEDIEVRVQQENE